MPRNNRIISFALSLVMILGLVIMPNQAAFAAEVQTLTIVHVNDVHGRVEENAGSKELGFAKLRTAVEMMKEEDPNLLFLNAGDAFHGTTIVNLTSGEQMVEMMNAMEFDAMVPGNHDFNYGYEQLMKLKGLAEFPILGANIVHENTTKSDFDPYVIYTMENGLKVGIFGLGTDETKYKSSPKNTVGIEFTDAVAAGKKMVAELQSKTDIIIALVHLGDDASSINTSDKLAMEVPGIDLIVDGHSHTILKEGKLVNGTLIVQAEAYTKNIGIVKMEITDGALTSAAARLMPYEEAAVLEADEEILGLIAEVKVVNEPIVSVVVGKTLVELDGVREHVRTGETNLGNLITDAMRMSTGADVAFTNGGGIRASIDVGDITVNEILTSFPFTNTLAVIEVTGAELLAAIEHGVKDYPAAAGQFPHVSGMKYTFDAGKPAGSRVTMVMIGDEALDPAKTYKVVTNDFMAVGGDGYTMFSNKPFVGEGGLLSDVLIEYVEANVEISPAVEGRVTAIPAPPAPPAPEPPKHIEYVVKPGDWLSKIGRAFGVDWRVLAEHNNLKNPDLIFPNQIIMIPQ
ncbi:5'-nucleotidase C-terminal domain-containing protein [Gudongella oleilytica]|uniref:5'-nucleotidase C-terminal domain-containing protein n=1 Tax=Gudongella oleilytica TaxID=1582259 RepID=UPI002A36DF70|nr:5'-nucleotidase C-terminal domain-containing protein [Gudongella oleilytica]MDY0255871.1 5'-nucleotidase C-terminal domain-containing protein [Gudongella oleilytica]